MEILHDHLIGVNDDGFIAHLASARDPTSVSLLSSNPAITQIPRGSFLLPTFTDLHLHAPQFLYAGTGLHLPLMEWLGAYAFRAEERIDADLELARTVYRRLAARLVEAGTGAALLFGTIKEDTNLLLAEVMQSAGLRAFVGKLSMDISSRPSYVESSAEEALAAVSSFITRHRAAFASLPPHRRLGAPVITPRFVPSCSDKLLEGLGRIAESEDVRIQSHLAESSDQVDWVKSERGLDDIDIFDRAHLLTSRTVEAHCTYLDRADLIRLCARGTSVAHCPLSNAYFSAKPFALREALDEGVKVGLGSDIAGGYALDLSSVGRWSVSVSRIREGARTESEEASKGASNVSVNWREALYLATKGGAVALGLPEGCGTFSIGAPFDAQLINVGDANGKFDGIGALDFFDDFHAADAEHWILMENYVEKWWSLGDGRNRSAMWVQGVQLMGPFSKNSIIELK